LPGAVAAAAAMCSCRQICRWLPVLFVVALISWCYFVFTYDILLLLLNNPPADVGTTAQGFAYTVTFNVIFVMGMISFVSAVFTDPGRIPDSWIVGAEDTEQGHFIPALQTLEVKHDGTRRICRKSKPNVYKPDRAHFCKMLGRCVLKMDHFCPWLNNCIGFYNHKFFVLFIVYMAVECIFILVVTTPVFMMIINNMEEVTLDLHDAEFHISLTYMMVCLLAVGLCAFSGFHLYLALGNYTTIEFLEKRGCQPPPGHVNRYNLGGWRNLCAVLGDNPLVWPLPVRWTCRGDGLRYDLNPAVGQGAVVQYAKKPM